MGHELRICTAFMPQFVKFESGGQVTGFLAPVFTTAFAVFSNHFPNISSQTMMKLGDRITSDGRYDGCLGNLQDNESDIIIPAVEFPILGPGLSQGNVVHTSRTIIGTVYNSTQLESVTDVMDAFSSFRASVWFLVLGMMLMLCLTMIAVWCLNYEVKRNRVQYRKGLKNSDDSKKVVRRLIRTLIPRIIIFLIGIIVKQHSSYRLKSRSGIARLVLLTMAVFSFLVSLYWSAMIKTEKVVMVRPLTIDSYQDILSSKIRPVWAKAFTEHWDFRDADKDSLMGKIWSRAKEIGMGKCYYEFTSDSIQSASMMNIQRKAVWLGPGYLIPFTLTNGCTMAFAVGAYPEVNGWMHSDPSAREKLYGMMKASGMARKKVRLLDWIAIRSFEHKIMDMAIKKLDFIYSKQGISSSRVQNCMANKIVYPDHVVSSPSLHHYRNLFKTILFSLFFASLVFALELLLSIRNIASRGRKTSPYPTSLMSPGI